MKQTNQTPRHPRLSVTVLNYNYARYLRECLDSILAQTFVDLELIVIDDRSTDNSLDVIAPYLQDPRVRLVAHQQNRGFVASLIEGTEQHSRGEFLAVISADDLAARRDAFEIQVNALDAQADTVMCFSSFSRFNSDTGEFRGTQISYDGNRIVDGFTFLRDYLTDMRVQVLHSGTVVRRSAYLASGGYRPDARYAVDFALWPVLALEGKVAYCMEALYKYRAHGTQMSHSISGVSATMADVVGAIETACARASLRGLDGHSVRGDALRCGLFADALDDAFSGRTRLALARCAAAVRMRPREALTARGLWIILARLLFPGGAFRRIRAVARTAAAITARLRRTGSGRVQYDDAN